jgi:hypothetical protein
MLQEPGGRAHSPRAPPAPSGATREESAVAMTATARRTAFAPVVAVAAVHAAPAPPPKKAPLILFREVIRPGEDTRAVRPADIAPTLAYLRGVPLAHADGEVLTGSLATPARAVEQGR